MSKKKKHAPSPYNYNYDGPPQGYDPREQKRAANKKLIPFNIIIAAIALAGMLSLLLGNFWTFSVSYKLDEKTLEKFISNNGGEGASLEGVDLSSLDLDVTFGVSIALEPDMLLKAAAKDNTGTVKEFLDPLITGLLGQAKDVFKSVLKSVAKLAIATAINEFNNALAEEVAAGAPEVAAAVQGMDMEKINGTIDELFADDPDISAIKGNLSSLISEQAMAQYENQSGEPLTTEQKAELQNEIDTQIGGAIDGVINEMGGEENFNVNNIVLKMVSETGLVKNVGEGEQLTEENLTAALRESVMGAMNEQTIKTAAIAIKVISFMLIIPLAAWALLLLFAVLRIFTGYKGVKMGFAKLVCAGPHIILVGIPSLLVKYAPAILEKAGQADMSSGIMETLSDVSVNISSLTWISAVCVAALYVVSIFFYGKKRRQAKRLK